MLASPTSGHDPGNAEKIATWEHPFVGRLAPGCWRWLKLNGKADCPTALPSPEVVQINVRSTGTLRQTQDAFFGSNCQKCVERTPDKTPNNKPRSIAETIGCESDTLTSRKARSGKFPWISGVHRRTNPSPIHLHKTFWFGCHRESIPMSGVTISAGFWTHPPSRRSCRLLQRH